MNETQVKRNSVILVAGDLVVLILVTIYGFATHGEIGAAGTRMLTTLLPLSAAWFMLAPFLGLYKLSVVSNPQNLWKPFYCMVMAAPMAALLRAALLGMAVILPVFIVVLGGISALAIFAWRLVYWFIFHRKSAANG